VLLSFSLLMNWGIYCSSSDVATIFYEQVRFSALENAT
jgi:hypothetical protein